MTTELYIVRHGLAGERGTYTNDDERPLTDEGIRKTKQVAKRLTGLDVQVDLILTSPLVRAHQTAQILQDSGISKSLEESAYLAPAGDFDGWLTWLQQWQGQRLAIVGHEPDLGEWAERLVWGDVRHHLIIKKAGVLGLFLPDEFPVGNSQLFLLIPPRYLL